MVGSGFSAVLGPRPCDGLPARSVVRYNTPEIGSVFDANRAACESSTVRSLRPDFGDNSISTNPIFLIRQPYHPVGGMSLHIQRMIRGDERGCFPAAGGR